MRRALTIIALATPLALNAQTGVVTTHPANPDGKQITMEEAVLGRNVRPASVAASWKDSDTFITYKDGKWMQENLSTGEVSEYSATRLPEGCRERHAQQCRNIRLHSGQEPVHLRQGSCLHR